MSFQLQIKRSPNNTPPSTLQPGELAWVEGTQTLYVGTTFIEDSGFTLLTEELINVDSN